MTSTQLLPAILVLCGIQAATILLPTPAAASVPARLRSRWWALVPPASLLFSTAAISARPATGGAFAWLAVLAVPPLAALPAARLLGSRAAGGGLALGLFAVAALAPETAGGLAGAALVALACATLAGMLAAATPTRWLIAGIAAMGAADVLLIATGTLPPVMKDLYGAAPGDGFPSLHVLSLGTIRLGFGDIFVAAIAGAILVSHDRDRLIAAAVTAATGTVLDVAMLPAHDVPATVPVLCGFAIAAAALRPAARQPAGAAQVAGTSAPPSSAILAPTRMSAGCGEIFPATSASPSRNVVARPSSPGGTNENASWAKSMSADEFMRMRTRLSHCVTTFSWTF